MLFGYPVLGMRSFVTEDFTTTELVLDRIWHLMLPSIILAIHSIAGISRYTRSSMLEVIRQDYVRTAKAKGLPEEAVYYKHALRNALLPIITIFGFLIPDLIGGSIIMETVFAWPGIGRLSLPGRPRKGLSRGDDHPDHIGRAHAHRKFYCRYSLRDRRSANSIWIIMKIA